MRNLMRVLGFALALSAAPVAHAQNTDTYFQTPGGGGVNGSLRKRATEVYERAYKQALAGLPGIAVLDYDPAERNSHHYVVVEVGEDCVSTRDQVLAALHAENILARKYFWPGSHMMQPYRDLFPHAGLMLSNTERVAERVVVLPTGTAVSPQAIESTCATIRMLASAPA